MEYTIKIKKYSWWWLLLLLPLLLLIKCKKDIYVKVLNSETNLPVSKVSVYLQHDKQSLRQSGKSYFSYVKTTNSKGIAKFIRIEYRLLSIFTRFFSKTKIYSYSGCYNSDTLELRFHSIRSKDTLILELSPILVSMDFKVIDSDDKQPLPDAKVTIISEVDGKQYVDSVISKPDGRVVFQHIPKCGVIKKVIAATDGYSPDSIINKNFIDLTGDINIKRLLKLKPIRKPIEFFVIDCRTNKPIPGAKVTIHIDFSSKKYSQTKHTNVDGVGKGVYDSLHVIADISLVAEKPYYKQGVLPGKYKVKDFINLPKEKRTICLEPLENCIEFKNIDKNTGQPLAGVENIVTVIKSDGTTKTNNFTSDKDGKFSVCDLVIGDKISIISKYPPDYEDNDKTIRNTDIINLLNSSEKDRTIPLKPKEVELIFRTVDFKDGSIIPEAELKISVNGSVFLNVKTDKNGEYRYKFPINSVISITASKTGYGSNDTTIRNKSVRLLITAPGKNDIPLKRIAIPCNNQYFSGGDGITITEFDMTGTDEIRIVYNMETVPDHMIIYCDKKDKMNKIIFNTGGKVSGKGQTNWIKLNQECGTNWITVKIVGGNGTFWEYTIQCK